MDIIAPDGSTYAVNRGIAAKARKYEKYIESVKEHLASDDPKSKAARDRANGAMRQKFMTPGAVHVDSVLTNISIQYANEAYIGSEIMPSVQVAKDSGDYFIYDRRNRLAYPDDQMSSRSRANEISETRSLASYSCRPYGLMDFIPADTLQNQDAPLDEMVDLVQAVDEGEAFKREARIAAVVTNAANYSASNTKALTGTAKWNGSTGGTPVADLLTGRAALWSGRGATKIVAATDIFTWNALCQHPAILDLFKYGGKQTGLATPEMIASYFRIDELYIAEARNDTANENQAIAAGRMWPNFFWLGRVMKSPGLRNAAFGLTFRSGPVNTSEWFDQSIGTSGGYYARVTTKEDHKVVAADTAYLFTTPIV